MLPPTGETLSSSQNVVFLNCGVAASRPLTGGVPIDDVIRELERDAGMAEHFRTARRTLGEAMSDGHETLRILRLRRGMSQEQLAQRADTTQAYIARIEASKADPGTDIITRLARALQIDVRDVFAAIQAERQARYG